MAMGLILVHHHVVVKVIHLELIEPILGKFMKIYRISIFLIPICLSMNLSICLWFWFFTTFYSLWVFFQLFDNLLISSIIFTNSKLISMEFKYLLQSFISIHKLLEMAPTLWRISSFQKLWKDFENFVISK